MVNFEGEISHIKNADDIAALREKRIAKFPSGVPKDYRAPSKYPSKRASQRSQTRTPLNNVTPQTADNNTNSSATDPSTVNSFNMSLKEYPPVGTVPSDS